MRDRDAAYRRARKYNNPDDWNLARCYRNRIEDAINYNKSKYMKEFFTINRNDSKRFCEGIRGILPKDHTQSVSKLIDRATNEELKQEEIPQYINDYFSTIGEQLAS